MSVTVLFDAVFDRAEAGRAAPFTVRHPTGGEHRFDPAVWCRDDLPGDETLLARCTGPTLDVGCGPGRLAGALAHRGCPALGIDVSGTAVRLARRRGASALRRDVFDPLPGTGRWHHLLLADGNIGIGGDPARLLRRCRHLLAPDGRLHVEAAAPGTPGWSGPARVDGGGTDLPWACVPLDDLPALAAASAMRLLETWTGADRWFATLIPH
ncbi:methyltransferase domain-containing protein [Paractinoplanes toevensis]|uniref:Methyltransferase type 12 n=1 Tax=Paractinoplanes toevensis TaxID=571911 RepID=A0A919T8P5_9ACTN|nr:methyltransferase domain-containing protein [Actinoplanes toevensis]GIM89759.1 methyltransferase type 12 [Actinoplanes toevensis]